MPIDSLAPLAPLQRLATLSPEPAHAPAPAASGFASILNGLLDGNRQAGEPLAEVAEKLKAIAKALFERPGLRLEIRGTAEPQRDRERLRRKAFDEALAAEQSAAPERSADEVLLALHAARTGTAAAPAPAPPAEDADEATRSAQDAALQEWRAELVRTLLGSFEVSDEDLLELAAARAQAIKSVVLAPREEGNVDPAQVYLLQPELRPQAEGVDIVIELELGGR